FRPLLLRTNQIPGLPILGIQSATSGTHPRADPGLYCLAHCSCLGTPVQAKPIQPFQLVLLDLQHWSDSYRWHVAVRGTMTVVGSEPGPATAGISGLGHIFLTLGMVLLFLNLRTALKPHFRTGSGAPQVESSVL